MPAQNTAWSGSRSSPVSASRTIANARLVAGPARLTRVFCRFVIHDVRRYTAPPGRPIPPSAMNSAGSPSESSGCEYFNGFSVR